jgi:hypothetical protein
MEVETVEERSGYPFRVALADNGRADAQTLGIARIPAGTGVLGRYAQKSGWVAEASRDTGNSHRPIFEGLTESLKNSSRELRQFVEEQNAAVSERYFARFWDPPAAHDRRGRSGMMRTAEGPFDDERG